MWLRTRQTAEAGWEAKSIFWVSHLQFFNWEKPFFCFNFVFLLQLTFHIILYLFQVYSIVVRQLYNLWSDFTPLFPIMPVPLGTCAVLQSSEIPAMWLQIKFLRTHSWWCTVVVAGKKKNRKPPTGFSPGRVAHLVGASFHTPKGFGFDPQSGHVWKEAYRCFSFISVFLSPTSSLSKINKYILGWKLKKKKSPTVFRSSLSES